MGFLRERRSNGAIFEQQPDTLTLAPTPAKGVHSLRTIRPFGGMLALCREFDKTLAIVRNVSVSPDSALKLVRNLIGFGWPALAGGSEQ